MWSFYSFYTSDSTNQQEFVVTNFIEFYDNDLNNTYLQFNLKCQMFNLKFKMSNSMCKTLNSVYKLKYLERNASHRLPSNPPRLIMRILIFTPRTHHKKYISALHNIRWPPNIGEKFAKIYKWRTKSRRAQRLDSMNRPREANAPVSSAQFAYLHNQNIILVRLPLFFRPSGWAGTWKFDDISRRSRNKCRFYCARALTCRSAIVECGLRAPNVNIIIMSYCVNMPFQGSAELWMLLGVCAFGTINYILMKASTSVDTVC